MNELFLKAKRAIRFLFYKDISIVDQIRISKILDNEQLEQLFWKMSRILTILDLKNFQRNPSEYLLL